MVTITARRVRCNASLLACVGVVGGAAGSASVKRRVRRYRRHRVTYAIGFSLTIPKHQPLFIPQLLELELTQ